MLYRYIKTIYKKYTDAKIEKAKQLEKNNAMEQFFKARKGYLYEWGAEHTDIAIWNRGIK